MRLEEWNNRYGLLRKEAPEVGDRPECDACGTRLEDRGEERMTSSPLQANVRCPGCGFEGRRFCRDRETRMSLAEWDKHFSAPYGSRRPRPRAALNERPGCDTCGTALVDEDNSVLYTDPARRWCRCPQCGTRHTRVLTGTESPP